MAAREDARACWIRRSASTLKVVASSANCMHSRRSASEASSRRTSSRAARLSACSARSADTSDWKPSAWSAICARSAAISASSAARLGGDLDGAPPPPPPLPPDADDEVPPRQAAAELRSGLSGVEVAPRGLAMGRLRGVEARCEGAGDASGDGGERRIVCGRLVQAGSNLPMRFSQTSTLLLVTAKRIPSSRAWQPRGIQCMRSPLCVKKRRSSSLTHDVAPIETP